MTSEIRVNKLQNRVGLGTVEYTNTGIVVSGIVTCTELSGLTALNIAGVGTANTLDINGDIDVDGHTELDNTNIVGLVTVTNVSSGIGLKLIDASGKQFVAGGGGGGSPFAGSFTGQDFRIQVGGLQNAIFKYASGATGNLELGPSSGIGITFNGATGNAGYAGIVTASGMLNANGDITITSPSPTINFTENNGDPDYRIFLNGGILNIDDVTNNVQKFSINTTRITLNGTTLVNDNTLYIGDKLVHWTDDDTMIRFPSNNTISFETAGSERLRITSGGEVKLSNGSFVNVDTNPGATYGVAEALRIDDGGGVADRALQIFEYSHSGARFHRIQFNTNTTTDGSAYTYTQGNYGGSSGIQFNNSGHLQFYADSQVSNGSQSSITPSERLVIRSDGNIGAGGITYPLWTSGGGIHLNDNYGIGFGNGGSGRPDFQLMVTDGSKLEFRCGYGADTADIVMDTSGRLLIGTTTNSISSSELFEVKSSATGFSHFRNNSSSYAPIYIDNEYSDTGFAPLLTFTDGGGNRGGIGQDQNDLLRITGQGGVSIYTAGTHGGGTEKFQVTQAGQINLGSSGTLKAIINESSISGHYFVSQCSDNNNGFEIYQQHGSTATRNTLAVYDNRRGSKIESLLIRGDGVKVTRSRGGNYARTYEFNYNTGAPGSVQTVSLATVINYGGTTSAVADVTYVGVYGTANDYIYTGHWICGVRRANNDGAWNQTAAEVAGNGSSSTSSIDVYWSSGQLYAQTVGPWMGWTVNVRITILNGEITVNV